MAPYDPTVSTMPKAANHGGILAFSAWRLGTDLGNLGKKA